MTKLLLRLFAAGDASQAATRVRIGKLSGGVGIVCNILLCIVKLIVAWLSGAVSVAADAMNNLSDATSSVVTLIGFRLAEKPADEDHPYGHARYEYLSGLAVAAMIIVIGFELGKGSVEKIFAPVAVAMTPVAFGILIGSVLVKLWLYGFNRTLGNRISSTALMATATDCRNDVIATSVVLLAMVVEHVFHLQIDGYAGLGVACFILYSGIAMAKQTISPLLGESASPELQDLILTVVRSEPKILGYHDLMVHDYGPGQRFASIHVEMDQKESALECHELIDRIERDCLELHNVHLVIHYDPVVTDDPELDALREQVLCILRQWDSRISIHDFRMVRGNAHTNLIFDIALPAERMGEQKQIKKHLDDWLNTQSDVIYHTVVTFDMASFQE